MRKKNLIVFGMTDNLGGTEQFFHNYYKTLRNYFTISFICMSKTIAYQDEYEKDACTIYRLPNIKKHPLGFIRELNRIHTTNNDVVYYNMLSFANCIPILFARKRKIKIVLHSHNTSTNGAIKKILHTANKWILRNKSTANFACSDKAGNWMFGDNNYEFIPNAIDSKKFAFDAKKRKEIRKRYGIANSEKVIGHIGRFVPEKNHKYIIAIFEKYHKQDPHSKLMLVGDGKLKKRMQQIVEKKGLKKSVLFCGITNTPQDYYQAMDVFIMPSKYEGLSLVAVEAQMSGLNCILTDNMDRAVNYSNNCKFINIRKKDIKKWVEQIWQSKRNKTIKNHIFDLPVASKSFAEKINSIANHPTTKETRKVSIIIPTYNSESTIKKCVSSAINQTYRNIEVIVVDDGSTDNTKALLKKIAAIDRRISIISKKNGGVSEARNAGIKKSSGDLLLFLDSDDYIEKNMVEEMVKDHNSNSMEVCAFKLIFSNKERVKNISLPKNNKVYDILPQIVNNSENIGGYMCGKLFESKIIKKNDIWLNSDLTMLEDALFVTEYLTHIKYVNIINKPLYCYQQSRNSTTHNQIKHIQSIERALIKIREINLKYNKNANVDYLSYLQKDYYVKDAKLDKKTTSEIKKIKISKLKISPRLKIKYLTKKVFGKKVIGQMKQILKRERLHE